jgi:carboxymethylenebutenolidase
MRPDTSRYLKRLNATEDYLVREFVDNYEDGVMSRRDLVERIYRITGSIAATAGILLALGVQRAGADSLASAPMQAPPPSEPMSPFSVPENDPAVIAGPTTFESDGATIMAYLARPRGTGRYPAVLICHENQGTSEHFRDVTRRFAKAGYVGLHLDLLSRQGGTEAVPMNERGAILSSNVEQYVEDFRSGMAFLRRQGYVLADRIGMTGYCYGGGMTWNVAVKEPTLRAAVPYYGVSAYPEEIGNIRAAVLGVYGERDTRLNAAIEPYREQLQAAGRTFRLVVYPNAGHAFFNDTRPNVYVESASTAAWRDTLNWFDTYLRARAFPRTGNPEPVAGGDA